VLFQELSDVEKPVFLRPYLNSQTLKLLFMSDVEKEVTKWLRSWPISQN
jgi:hypothetical protein